MIIPEGRDNSEWGEIGSCCEHGIVLAKHCVRCAELFPGEARRLYRSVMDEIKRRKPLKQKAPAAPTVRA